MAFNGLSITLDWKTNEFTKTIGFKVGYEVEGFFFFLER
jgi:hypothetical protein